MLIKKFFIATAFLFLFSAGVGCAAYSKHHSCVDSCCKHSCCSDCAKKKCEKQKECKKQTSTKCPHAESLECPMKKEQASDS